MHYIKYDVNSSLLTYLWLLQKVCGTLDHCFITTHNIHEGDTLQIYFWWYPAKQGTTHSCMSRVVHIWTEPFLWPREEHIRQRRFVEDFAGQCWLWPTLESENICCGRTWSSNQYRGGAILALYSFLNQSPHQQEPEISVGIFSPTWR